MSSEPSIVTVTLNPAIDQTLNVPGFAAGRVNRVTSAESHPAGKGVNVAVMLADLGERPVVTGFLGHDNAAIFEHLFASKQIHDAFVRIPGETRTGIKIVDHQSGDTTDINFPGLTPTADAIDALRRRVADLANADRWFVFCGSVPAGVDNEIYATLIDLARRNGARVALDTSGPALDHALAHGPDIVKPNIVELAELAGTSLDSHGDVVRVARKLLLDRGVKLAVVSMGGEGAIFIDRERAILAVPPKVTVKSTVGAGDAMVAGLVHAQVHGHSLEHAARIATALGTQAVTRIGAGIGDRTEYERLVQTVLITNV